MKADEIKSLLNQSGQTVEAFVRGRIPSDDFCQQIGQMSATLKGEGGHFTPGSIRNYQNNPRGQLCVRITVHEMLHKEINLVCGVPTEGIGAIQAEDTPLFWGVTLIDHVRARTTPGLDKKVRRAQFLHNLVDKLGI